MFIADVALPTAPTAALGRIIEGRRTLETSLTTFSACSSSLGATVFHQFPTASTCSGIPSGLFFVRVIFSRVFRVSTPKSPKPLKTSLANCSPSSLLCWSLASISASACSRGVGAVSPPEDDWDAACAWASCRASWASLFSFSSSHCNPSSAASVDVNSDSSINPSSLHLQ